MGLGALHGKVCVPVLVMHLPHAAHAAVDGIGLHGIGIQDAAALYDFLIGKRLVRRRIIYSFIYGCTVILIYCCVVILQNGFVSIIDGGVAIEYGIVLVYRCVAVKYGFIVGCHGIASYP